MLTPSPAIGFFPAAAFVLLLFSSDCKVQHRQLSSPPPPWPHPGGTKLQPEHQRPQEEPGTWHDTQEKKGERKLCPAKPGKGVGSCITAPPGWKGKFLIVASSVSRGGGARIIGASDDVN